MIKLSKAYMCKFLKWDHSLNINQKNLFSFYARSYYEFDKCVHYHRDLSFNSFEPMEVPAWLSNLIQLQKLWVQKTWFHAQL
jgi:hypothetical protein